MKCFLFLLISLFANQVQTQSIPEAISPLHQQYQDRKGNLVQYRRGDILIGALIRAHKRGAGDKCSTVLEDGIQALETINMIVDQVNANSSILPGLKLGTIMVDTCDIDTHALQRAVTSFLPYFWGQRNSTNATPAFAGVVGASSSAVSIQTASLLQIFKIPQVSPWSTHPDLSNKNRFPYFFRAVPSDAFQASAMVALAKLRKWNYISIVYEDDFYGVRGYREVDAVAVKQGICIAVAQAIPRSPTAADFNNTIHKLLAAKKARAVVVFTKRHDAEMLIEAAEANPKSRGYFQWVGSDGWSGTIPTNGATSNYNTSLNGAITFKPKTSVVKPLAAYMANLTLGEHLNGTKSNSRNPWFPEYIRKRFQCVLTNNASESVDSCSPEAHLDINTFHTLSKMQSVADATLAIVASLHEYQQTVCPNQIGCQQIKAMAGTNKLADIVYRILKNVTYTGINGDLLSFDSNQDGQAVYDLQMYQKNTSSKHGGFWINAATFRNEEITWRMPNGNTSDVESVCSQPCSWDQATLTETSACCWHCETCSGNSYVGNNGSKCVECPVGSKPDSKRRGCDPLTIQSTRFDSAFSISSMALAVVGLIMTSIAGGIFLKHRDSAIVKASGKELCVFVLGGATLCFLNSFVLSAPAMITTCIVSRVFLAFGPTLMYAGLLAKTIRVVIIFQAKSFLSPQVKTFLRPKFQILTAFAFTFLQAFVITVWFAVSPPSITTTYPNDDVAFRSCNDVGHLLVLVGLAYPLLLILTCTVLATVNRNVPTGFNETQYIGFTMYATCVTWLAFLPIFITNASNVPLKVATVSICLDISAITVLICLFSFRCYVIIFHPENNTSKSVMSSVQNPVTNSTGQKKDSENRVSEIRNDSAGRGPNDGKKATKPLYVNAL